MTTIAVVVPSVAPAWAPERGPWKGELPPPRPSMALHPAMGCMIVDFVAQKR